MQACLSSLTTFVSVLPSAAASASGPNVNEKPRATQPPLVAPMDFSTDSKARPLTKDSKILIVGGGGTMGSSTALHLARRGYRNIRILDQYCIPSNQSAGGGDINKLAGESLAPEGFRGKLSAEIMMGWREDPVFKDHYHETGRFTGAYLPSKITALRDAFEGGRARGLNIEWLGSREEIISKVPQLADAKIEGWQGLWTPASGWVDAKDTIHSVALELQRLGVSMSFGRAGTFSKPLLSPSGTTCIGIECVDGTRYEADRVVVAAGAWTPALIDLQGQCISKAWIVGHLQLTPEEAAPFQDLPTVYCDTLGFWVEPRPDGIFKICDEFSGYTRYCERQHPFGAPEEGVTISIPRSHATHPTDTIPTEGLKRLQRVVDVLLPQFAHKEIVDTKVCWCTDTADAEWLFCESKWKNLFIASGDSGHSFATIPIVGSEIADMLEGKLSREKQLAWGWRPGRGDPNGTGRGGPAPKDLGDEEAGGWVGEDPIDQI